MSNKIAIHQPELRRYFKIASDTNPDITYIIRRIADRWICSCPDFRKHSAESSYECKHVRAVLIEVQRLQDARIQAEMTRIAQEAEVRGLIATMQEQLDELRAQVAQLTQVRQPIHIKAEQIIIDGPIKAARQAPAKSQDAQATDEKFRIEEIVTGGKIVACMVDGHRLPLIHKEFTVGCTCDEADDKMCKHGKAVDAYLARRKKQPAPIAKVQEVSCEVAQAKKEYDPLAAPLNGNRGFSLLKR